MKLSLPIISLLVNATSFAVLGIIGWLVPTAPTIGDYYPIFIVIAVIEFAISYLIHRST